MREIGLEHVYQLEGGILKYLEQTDGRHWDGALLRVRWPRGGGQRARPGRCIPMPAPRTHQNGEDA